MTSLSTWFRVSLRAAPFSFVLTLLFLACSVGHAQTLNYQTVVYPGTGNSALTGINDSSVAVGYYTDTSYVVHGFIYQNGGYTTLDGPLGPGNTQLEAISSNGTILLLQTTQYFLWNGTQFTPVGTNGTVTGVSGTQTIFFTGLNGSGTVSGYYVNSFTGNDVAVYGTPALGTPGTTTPPTANGTFTQVACSGTGQQIAQAINNSGTVTGHCGSNGFLLSGGTLTTLNYPSATATQVNSINNTGSLIVGAYNPTGTTYYGFQYNGTTFSQVLPPTAVIAYALGVNNSGQIAGYYSTSGGATYGFILGPPPVYAERFGSCIVCKTGGFTTTPLTAGQPLISDVGQVQVSDPIDVLTGNVFYHADDYTTVGQNPLAFTRYYNSLSNAPGITTLATTLGINWRSNYDRYLQLSSSSITAERPDGQQVIFTLVGSTWTPNTDIDITLTGSGSTWTLTDHDDTVETYTAITSSEGQLSSIKTRNGYTQTLTYNGSNQLTTVTDSYSRQLTLTYSGGLLQTVATPDSTTITYGYTSATGGHQLTSATYPTSPSSTVTYVYGNSSFPFAMTGITDEDGNNFEAWTYDAFGRATSNQRGGGIAESTTITYTGNFSPTVTNAFGVADTYSFTPYANIPKVTGISRASTSTTAAATESFGYDSNGYMNSITDWNGNQTTYVNDSHGDPTTINEAVGSSVARTTTIAYDATWVHEPDTITTPGVTTTFTYDASGDPLTKTFTDTTTTTIPYSTNGQARTWTFTWSNYLLASVQTPRTDVTAVTSFGYDSTGALTSVTDALSHVTNITAHTGGGRPTTIVDPNSVTTTLTYDARQRLTSAAISGTGGTFTTSYTVDPTGEITKVTLPDSSYLSYAYDAAHRPTQVTDILGNFVQATLDALGDPTTALTKNSSSTTTKQHSGTFDALARTLTDVGGAGQTTTLTYDADGNALTVKDGLSHTTTRTFDALNRLSTSTDANSGVVTVTYDAHDRLLTVQDQNGNTTSYVYDGFGDTIQQASPDTGTTVYHYDNNGNFTSKTDALSVVTNQTFDKLDRVLTTAYPADTTLNVAYTYDQTGTGYSFGIGRLTSLTDKVGSLTRDYDELGNMLSEQRVNSSTTYTTTYSYDAASRIASITYPSGALVSYTRNTAGQVTSVTSKASSGSSTKTIASSVTYEPFGPVTGFTFGNSHTDTRTYDLDYRMTGVLDSSTAWLSYVYDNANNVSSITDHVNGGNSQTFGYDVINRLTSATSGYGGYGSMAWTLDKVGNLTKIVVNGSTINYTYTSGTNQLATIVPSSGTVTVSTNANGNITSIPPANNGTTLATYTYNAANRLSTVSGSPLGQTHLYDAFGRRFSKQEPGSYPILYFYGLDGRLLEENDHGTITDYQYLNELPLTTLTPSSGTYSYLSDDRLNVPTAATNSSGTIVWYQYYQPMGISSIAGSITQNLRFPGQYFDVETAFQYNRFRDYMPDLGRYLEADPIGLGGGMNPYLYANGNPTRFTDVLGLCEKCDDPHQKEGEELGFLGTWVGRISWIMPAPFKTLLTGMSAWYQGTSALEYAQNQSGVQEPTINHLSEMSGWATLGGFLSLGLAPPANFYGAFAFSEIAGGTGGTATYLKNKQKIDKELNYLLGCYSDVSTFVRHLLVGAPPELPVGDPPPADPNAYVYQ